MGNFGNLYVLLQGLCNLNMRIRVGEHTLTFGLLLGKREDLKAIFAFVLHSQLHFTLACPRPVVTGVYQTHFISG